jgi:LacI family transcriptional regulator
MSKPTLNEIAKKLGVSTATVSLAMKENSRISDKMRVRVLEEMRRSGYVYQRSAAGLRKAKTDTVGIILNNATDPFFSLILASIEGALAEKDMTAFLCNTNESVDRQTEFIRKMSEYNADGIILVPAIGTRAEDLEVVRTIAPPMVFFSRLVDNFPLDAVVHDERQAGFIAGQHLLALDHTRIAAVGGTADLTGFQERLAGIRSAFEASDIDFDPALVFECRPTRACGYEQAAKLLSMANPPTAAIGYNAIVSLGLKAGLQREGMRIGEDFSLIANENPDELLLTNPPLSTTGFATEDMGRAAVELLYDRIENPTDPVYHKVMDSELILRESTRPVPSV